MNRWTFGFADQEFEYLSIEGEGIDDVENPISSTIPNEEISEEQKEQKQYDRMSPWRIFSHRERN